MPKLHIKRIAHGRYCVRQYDEVLSVERVELGTMNEQKLHAQREAQHLIDYTASEVVDALNSGDEITVRVRVMF
jgi:hypothetical protein